MNVNNFERFSNSMKTYKYIIIAFTFAVLGCGSENIQQPETEVTIQKLPSPPLVKAARDQIGKVVKYDTGYYSGAYPPADRGACTDAVERALFANGYDLKQKVDKDMVNFPADYPHESDPNINFRRVRNVKVFFEKYAQSFPKEVNAETLPTWQAGDIVTYEQIPGSLWHIAIISDRKNEEGIPLLIHNYGRGVVEDDFLTEWPAPISGHFRLDIAGKL